MTTNEIDTWIQHGEMTGNEIDDTGIQLGRRKTEDFPTEEEIRQRMLEDSIPDEELMSGSDSDGYGEPRMTKREYNEYIESVERSEGFDVKFPKRIKVCMSGMVRPVCANILRRDYAKFKEEVDFALAEHKASEGDDLELVKIIKVNRRLGSGTVLYMTFKAKRRGSDNKDMIKKYQTQVSDNFRGKKTLNLFREAPPKS